MALNVKDDQRLEEVIKNADLAISLLPYTFHVKVAKFCLKHNTHLITTSYISPQMKELDFLAKEKGLLFLNEIGLDPGIDHMSAMKIIHTVQNKGGRIASFESCCGGLPAPEANDNPFGYKFSWSPRGVVMAGRNSAHYLKDKKEVKIPGKDLFKNHWTKKVEGLGELEVYPNRDSMIYRELYGLQEAETVFRGTFRNPGWCETLYNISHLGFLDDTEKEDLNGMTFAEVTASLIGSDSTENLRDKLADKIGVENESEIINRLEWLGLLSDDKVNADPPTILDAFTGKMLEKMPYKMGERDMIVLQHDFLAEYPNGGKEAICSLLIDYGVPNGDSSMSRTVSLPAAIAAKLILEGKIKLNGVHLPILEEIYEPVLLELETMNIKFVESVNKI